MAIKVEMLEDTVREAQRFLRLARELRANGQVYGKEDGWDERFTGGPLVAAATRASMDLTRQLAKFRKGVPSDG